MTIEKAKSILKQIRNTAQESSLTGSMEGGAYVLIKSYNAIFKYAVSQQWIEDIGIAFEIKTNEIPEDIEWMDYVGCTAAMLEGMLG